MRILGGSAALMLALLIGVPAMAGIYKWIDADGTVHYGDRPPGTGDAVEVESPAGGGNVMPAEGTKQVDDALRIVTDSREYREAQQRARAEAASERDRHRAQCDELAKYRERIAAGGFLYRRDDPERKALSDEELAAEVTELNRAYAENCASER